MAIIAFTGNIQRHIGCPEEQIDGDRLDLVLNAYFLRHPRARSYVVDDKGALRQHMVIFVDGVPAADRSTLRDALKADSDIMIFQALSGG